LVGTITGVPGDPSIKSTGEEGELYRKGPDMKRVITNAAIGAGVGAASGAAAGGGKGAAVGAMAGAGLGSGSSLLFHGREMKLEEGTNLEVRLDRDLVVPSR
jgi:outer membrane lipoprotein SlyB